ncbi:hypothetical protein H4R35_005273 [Dimargaris xerosporica]|nr:hypothetical protein H4R35_005273 [Dimargaris xerosporica]
MHSFTEQDRTTLRRMRVFAAVSQFFHIFHQAFDLRDFDTEQFENALLGSHMPYLEPLLIKLLRMLTHGPPITDKTWPQLLAKQYQRRNIPAAHLVNDTNAVVPATCTTSGCGFRTDEAPTSPSASNPPPSPAPSIGEDCPVVYTPFAKLSLSQRMFVFYHLTEWLMEHPERLRGKMKQTNLDDEWRTVPLGQDSSHRTYWLFNDNRLYRQRLPDSVQVHTKPIPTPKTKRRKKEAAVLAISPEAVDEEVADEQRHGQWELLLTTLDEWESWQKVLIRPRGAAERALWEKLDSEVAPRVINVLQRLQNQKRMEEAVNNRKRSSRIMRKQQALEEQQQLEKQRQQEGEARKQALADERAAQAQLQQKTLPALCGQHPASPKADTTQQRLGREARAERRQQLREQRDRPATTGATDGQSLTPTTPRPRSPMHTPQLLLSAQLSSLPLAPEQPLREGESHGQAIELPIPHQPTSPKQLVSCMSPNSFSQSSPSQRWTPRCDASYVSSPVTPAPTLPNAPTAIAQQVPLTPSDTQSSPPKPQSLVHTRFVHGRELTALAGDPTGHSPPSKMTKTNRMVEEPTVAPTDETTNGASEWVFNCVCGVSGTNVNDGKAMAACGRCDVWVHIACIDDLDRKSGLPKRRWNLDEYVCLPCRHKAFASWQSRMAAGRHHAPSHSPTPVQPPLGNGPDANSPLPLPLAFTKRAQHSAEVPAASGSVLVPDSEATGLGICSHVRANDGSLHSRSPPLTQVPIE